MMEKLQFGWINLFGIGIVVLIMIPNIIYALNKKNTEKQIQVSKFLLICEQIGRYACIVLMWFPLFIWEFGFNDVSGLIIYVIANAILLLCYYVFWILYAKRKSIVNAMALAIIPTTIFILSGVLLHHWTLVFFAILFGFMHCRITYITHKQ